MSIISHGFSGSFPVATKTGTDADFLVGFAPFKAADYPVFLTASTTK
jgi:hypothetical protein